MEHLLSWRRLCFFLVALVILQFAFLFSTQRGKLLGPSQIFDFRNQHHEEWWISPNPLENLRNDTIDALTAAQCDGEFPNLYYEVDRAVSYWRERQHTISVEDVDIEWRRDAALRILIHENELRILHTKGTYPNTGYRMRTLGVLSMLQKAIWAASAGGELLPTIEAAIVVDDMSLIPGDTTHSVWTFTSHLKDEGHRKHWLIPDFAFYSAPATGSFRETRRRAIQHDNLLIDKIQRAVWRGVKWTNEGIRGPLLDKTKDQSWADVKVINWDTGENIMTMDEMCKYAFLVHTEGRSYSGRLQFLLNCDSLPIIHDLEWNAHFYHLLVRSGEHQNYIPVKRDFSDLEKTVKKYLNDPVAAQKIATTSVNTFRSRYTSPAATSCYLRRLVQGWSQVSFTPEVNRPAEEHGGVIYRRGISFEEFVHLAEDYDDKKEKKGEKS